VCGFSGGPDSTALVALAHAAGLEVTAVFVDHEHRSGTRTDSAAAESIARRLSVEFRCECAPVPPGGNFEARARDARRAILGTDAMTGHTADDQAETVLLALLRGSGSSGLAGMTADDRHPLLHLRRHETHALCAALGINPVLDPTNDDARHRRNRVRSELIPLLDSIADRDTTPLVVRASTLLGDDDQLLSELADEIDVHDAPSLASSPAPLARRAIRTWLTVEGYPPDRAAVERVLDVARGTIVACEVTGVGRIHRRHQRLQLERSS
jgi:tRNA(Ile)-lysidine synthase